MADENTDLQPQDVDYEDEAMDDEVNVRVTGTKHKKPRVLLEWIGPSRVHVVREHNFFVTLFVAAVAAGFILVLFKEYTLMLVVFALAFTIYAANKHEPRIVQYQVTSTDVVIDTEHYAYKDLKSFWFDEEGGQMVLKIATKLLNPHYIDLVVSADSRDAIEDELLEYIPYERMEEGKFTKFIRRLVLPIETPLDRETDMAQETELEEPDSEEGTTKEDSQPDTPQAPSKTEAQNDQETSS